MLATWRDRGLELIKPHWITLLLIGGVVSSLLDSLAQAKWYPDAEPFVALALFSAVYGGVLAISKLRWRIAMSISAAVSIGVVLLLVGRCVPAPHWLFSAPLSQSLQIMHLRLMALLQQIGRGEQAVTLTAYGLLVWHVSVVLMWSLLRTRRVLIGVLLYALPLGLNLAASRQPTSLSMVFTISSVLLIARSAYLERLHTWDVQHLSYPELIGEDWVLGVTLIAALVLVLAGLSTPEWRASLERFFESLRPKITTSPVGPQPGASTAPPPTSFVPDVSVVGEPIPPDSTATLFWVRIDDPAPRLNANGDPLPPDRVHYWRGGIYGAYTGRGWELIGLRDDVQSMPITATVPPGRYVLNQKFDIVARHGSQLFAVNDPITASVAVRSIAVDDSHLLLGFSASYTVTSWAADVTADQLAADRPIYPDVITRTYLAVPDSVPPRVRELAQTLTMTATTAYDKAVQIQNYLRATYPYRLDVPPPPSDRDVVDYFLFDAPGGFCSYYASAMVVMLRSLGVPARVVTGYAMGSYVRDAQLYHVPASAAHAWVEVYFPTYGWIEFEPTASMRAVDYRHEAVLPPSSEIVPTEAPSTEVTTGNEAFVIGGVIASLIGLLLIAGSVRRHVIAERRSANQQAVDLYWQMRRALTPLGVHAAASVTPIEFAAHYLQPLEARPQLIGCVHGVAEAYIAATYTVQVLSREEVQALRRQWQRLWGQRMRVRLSRRAR
ncbi:MAG: transglutaminase domain-containing protein [Anaerolineae bacterium]